MSKLREFKLTPYQLFLLTPSITILFFIISICLFNNLNQEFVQLARSFYHGHLNFFHYPTGDSSIDIWKGQFYWALGPFPAIFILPFVALFNLVHIAFYQWYIQWLLVPGVLYMVFRLARKLDFSTFDSYILGFGFVLGSVFIGVSSSSASWYFAQVLTTFLLFASILEFYGKRRWWLIGVICGCVALTRISAAPIAIFYLLELWVTYSKKSERKQRLRQLFNLCLPLVLAVMVLGLYNFARFGNPLQQGYSYQILNIPDTSDRIYGLFSLHYIPANLYYFLLSTPAAVFRNNLTHILKFPFIQVNSWGLSVFFTSPYLLYLFLMKKVSFDGRTIRMLIAIGISAIMVLTYYGIGDSQYGYRYSLDFLPLLFMLFMIKYRQKHGRLSTGMKVLLLGSGITSLYMLLTLLKMGPFNV